MPSRRCTTPTATTRPIRAAASASRSTPRRRSSSRTCARGSSTPTRSTTPFSKRRPAPPLTLPREWDWVLDDGRRHQPFQLEAFAGMRDYYAASDAHLTARRAARSPARDGSLPPPPAAALRAGPRPARAAHDRGDARRLERRGPVPERESLAKHPRRAARGVPGRPPRADRPHHARRAHPQRPRSRRPARPPEQAARRLRPATRSSSSRSSRPASCSSARTPASASPRSPPARPG